MDGYSRAFYEVKFRLEFRSRSGEEFQDFFSSIMESRYPGDFQRIKPGGPHGDRKCDGYLSSEKKVFQAYAPHTMESRGTISKINQDFTGAKEHWKEQMRAWVFVHNQWRGLPADVLIELNRLTALVEKLGIVISRCCEPELKQVFFELSEHAIGGILGYSPTPRDFQVLDFKDLQIVIDAISQGSPTELQDDIKTVPPEKLKVNDLSESVQSLLVVGSRKSHLVRELFRKWHDPELGDRIANTFREKYKIFKRSGVAGDDLFQELWMFARGGGVTRPKDEAAVLAVLAFLFEECDIFEPGAIREAQ